MDRSDERNSLMLALCDEPSSRILKLVFADFLDDNGECGDALRWASRSDKWPGFLKSVTGRFSSWLPCWMWGKGFGRKQNRISWFIPKKLAFFVKTYPDEVSRHLTPMSAWDALIVGYQAAKIARMINSRGSLRK